MTRYELLKFLHVASVIIWLGAGVLLALLVFGAERAGNRAKEAGYHADVGWLAPRLFIPSSLAALIFGILLVADGPYEFDQLWIVIALVGWLASFGLGFFYFKPEGARIGALAQEHGPTHPEVDRRLRRLNVVDRIQLVILFLVVADMVTKPTLEDTGVLVGGAAVLAAAIVWGMVAVRRHGSEDSGGGVRSAQAT